jgi:hypothetical protein
MARRTITLESRIKFLLLSKEIFKEDDRKLISQIWLQDLGKMGLNPKNITGYQLLEIISRNKLTNPESIRRTKSKIIKSQKSKTENK